MVNFLSTVLMALVAVAPALAQTPPRGRPNHADLYGYPHNRGAPPPGVPRRPMTPGGYMDPRPANPGATCTANNQCSTDINNARASCNADGTCGFQCLGNTQFDGTTCAGMIQANRCSYDRQCSTDITNASGICLAGRCNFGCNQGFYAVGSTCAAADQTCGNQTCDQVPGGYAVCENGQCTARCDAHLGFQQFCNADNSVCQCINTANDVNNCGTPGNVCPPSYNGNGRAYCTAGRCGLSCNGFLKVVPRDSPAYCATRA